MEPNPPALTVQNGELQVRMTVWDRPGEAPCEVLVSVGGDAMVFDDADVGPLEHEAYARLFRDAQPMKELLLAAIAASPLPERAKLSGEAFVQGLRLQAIYLHRVARDGLAYVGYGFGSSSEREHGVGVLTHGERVVEVGGEDTALLAWVARRDRDGATTPKDTAAAKKAKKSAPKKGAKRR